MIEVRTYLPEMGINPDPQESPTRTLEKGNAGLSLYLALTGRSLLI